MSKIKSDNMMNDSTKKTIMIKRQMKKSLDAELQGYRSMLFGSKAISDLCEEIEVKIATIDQEIEKLMDQGVESNKEENV